MSYKLINVTSIEMLNRVYNFRYQIMCTELNIVFANDEELEYDKYDKYSDHFAILDEKDDICASMRLIHNSPIGYPTEEYLELSEDIKIYNRKKLGELSRIFIHSNKRNFKDSKIILNKMMKELAYDKIKEYDIDYVYGSVEAAFLRLINMCKIPYISIGDSKVYNGANRYPVILYTKALEFQNPQLLKE